MKEKQLELLKKVASGELKPEHVQSELKILYTNSGTFTIDDIEEVYNIGRAHQKNKSTITSKDIAEAWLNADSSHRNIIWD